MASFLPARRGLTEGHGPDYTVEALVNTDHIVWVAQSSQHGQHSRAWLKDGTTATIDLPFEQIRAGVMAQIDRASARGQVIAEILGMWDETLKAFPQLKKEHRIAVEWLTKTFTGSEMGV